MSYDEFVENGKTLKKLHLFVMNLNRGKTKSSKQYKRVAKAEKLITSLKSLLDDALYETFPEKDGQELSRVFYGETEEDLSNNHK